jgi:hypothetical protein
VPFRASEGLVGFVAPPLPLPGVLTANSAPYHPRIQRARAGCSQSELLASPRPQVPRRPSRPEAQPCLYRTVTRGDGPERPDRRGDEHGTRDDATGTRLFVTTPRSRARGQERRPRIVRSRGVGLRRCPIHRSAWKGVSTVIESPARNLLLRGSGRPGTRGVLQRRTREHSGGCTARQGDARPPHPERARAENKSVVPGRESTGSGLLAQNMPFGRRAGLGCRVP